MTSSSFRFRVAVSAASASFRMACALGALCERLTWRGWGWPLSASQQTMSSGRRWMRARRPELYGILTEPTGQEVETRRVRFGM